MTELVADITGESSDASLEDPIKDEEKQFLDDEVEEWDSITKEDMAQPGACCKDGEAWLL